ncbi:hypothetical protein DMB66_59250 [Actinoplanes sp. ATCC 53533]|uniref:hypothetical protein n=1 Tax=Actinoplanes sp. ATCC 53533 TaxID=1288362 RepID=UPI001000D31E|nr:hypothetical protein [Actinoplanes sp. ATCC 53533]RSM37980.1 hypothetical protein DMB66_59250 [Actinoplanes sp. ATCC 53533]
MACADRLGLLNRRGPFGLFDRFGLRGLDDWFGVLDRFGVRSLAGLWVAALSRLARRTRGWRRVRRRGICRARSVGFEAGGLDLEIFGPAACLLLADVSQPLGVTTL